MAERKYLWQMTLREIMSDDYAYTQLQNGFGVGFIGYDVMIGEALKRGYPVPKDYILNGDPTLLYLFE